ncbi:hypothetical protein PMAYCL1PPCAC_20738 [Pristionchus mayeri]|uniref:Membrane insertase YidC/Oxa/ALB C-terminal domain-containing protein n=1 Tax=Pristionchus mayeri TaxID=1317129 RepID=A0AAN5CTQ3_9BILA|nr:hypothetical protein PMAYCL1PPCAC_20738 [Pristionchus mayeri]
MLSLPRALAPVGRSILTCRVRVVGASVAQRSFSSKDHIFDSTSSLNLDLPPLPVPPPPTPSISELFESGQSVLGEFGLLSWWKPSSYFREALEGIHMYADIPWWLTIVSATVALRLALIYVPIMSQRLVAKQNQYKPELDKFRERQEDARREGNNQLCQQIFIEQRDFMKAKDIKMFRQLGVLMANGCVFMTQFFAIKKMIEVNYPGLSTGGTLWFTDLTLADPYYVLPLLSAATLAIVSRVGIEMGQSSDTMGPYMRAGMLYGLPVIVFAVSTQFGSGLCVYWCASNAMSLAYAVLFRLEPIRKMLKLPPIVKYAKPKNAFKEIMASRSNASQAPPSLASLKSQDAQRFKKAGSGKPMI